MDTLAVHSQDGLGQIPGPLAAGRNCSPSHSPPGRSQLPAVAPGEPFAHQPHPQQEGAELVMAAQASPSPSLSTRLQELPPSDQVLEVLDHTEICVCASRGRGAGPWQCGSHTEVTDTQPSRVKAEMTLL